MFEFVDEYLAQLNIWDQMDKRLNHFEDKLVGLKFVLW
jgi:hypothetical protein